MGDSVNFCGLLRKPELISAEQADKVQILWECHKFFFNYLVTSKPSGIFFQIFVAFSKYLNFIFVNPNITHIAHILKYCF